MKEEMTIRFLFHRYRYELDSWHRWLTYQKEELVNCKNRLAEIINNCAEDNLLLAEKFQEEFLAEESKAQTSAIENGSCQVAKEVKDLEQEQEKLRRSFWKAGELFLLIKNKFLQFLQEL
jgi:hypothetical protein